MTTGDKAQAMPLWKRLWLLVSLIWALVALINAATIYFIGAPGERSSALVPLAFAFIVPAGLYIVLWVWFRLRGR